jgi:hypothetical protein
MLKSFIGASGILARLLFFWLAMSWSLPERKLPISPYVDLLFKASQGVDSSVMSAMRVMRAVSGSPFAPASKRRAGEIFMYLTPMSEKQ